MTKLQKASYGSWRSPLTADVIAASTLRWGGIMVDADHVYWSEGRPAEGGRYVIVRWSTDGQRVDLTPAPFNARTRVHEYGGGAFTVSDGVVFFANFADQRLYRQDPATDPRPITPDTAFYFADPVVDRPRGRLICVREDHSAPGREEVNTIVELAQDGDDTGGHVLVSGNDFYASPRLSPDGAHLAWLTWNHPNMPWDGTELWLGRVQADGSLSRVEKVAGGRDESIVQPEWSPDGTLYFVSDRSGWWNLYRWRDGRSEALLDMVAEFGRPQWLFDWSTYAFLTSEELVTAYTKDGNWYLAEMDLATGRLSPFDLPYTEIQYVRARAGRVIFLAGSPTEPSAIIQYDPANGDHRVLRRSSAVPVDAGYLSRPQAIEFPTAGDLTAHAFFYPPQNSDYVGPSGERPPLLVLSHGGPTSAARSWLELTIHFWTSRGFAVLDVNYGGSTGYGRAYRQRLDGQWGVVDVEDCLNGARYLVKEGVVDGERLAIRGGSAGGYTTLAALTFHDLFKAGASYFGISDLEAMTRETHKFESRYLDRLVGPYPEQADRYRARSPIHHAERLSCPVIFFQGLEDKIVPPSQAEMLVAALRTKRVPVAYIPFVGEQHGFRQAENMTRALEAELYFYSRIFGFDLAETIEPVEIENLDALLK